MVLFIETSFIFFMTVFIKTRINSSNCTKIPLVSMNTSTCFQALTPNQHVKPQFIVRVSMKPSRKKMCGFPLKLVKIDGFMGKIWPQMTTGKTAQIQQKKGAKSGHWVTCYLNCLVLFLCRVYNCLSLRVVLFSLR